MTARTVQLVQRLREQASERLGAPLSVLRVNGRPACISLSIQSRGVLHCWFVAYDPDLAAYSPGQTFFLRFAEAAAAQGVAKLDLGKGDERYKCPSGKELSAALRFRSGCATHGGKRAIGSTILPSASQANSPPGLSSRFASGLRITNSSLGIGHLSFARDQ
jgi:CelD/BcsL family acetyltransferase involved in cellulose biosynthesis